jgi:hypothetical protein
MTLSYVLIEMMTYSSGWILSEGESRFVWPSEDIGHDNGRR